MARDNGSAYIGWGIALLIFAGLCFQIRSCAIDEQKKVQTSQNTQQPIEPPKRQTLKRREPQKIVEPKTVEIEQPVSFAHPTVKQVDNGKYRVSLTKSDGWFNTGLEVHYKDIVKVECEETDVVFLWDTGGRKVFCACPDTRGWNKTYSFDPEWTVSSGVQTSNPQYRNTIKVKIFDESPSSSARIYFEIRHRH